MFKAGRQHLKDAAKRASEPARRVVASSREKFWLGVAYLDEAVSDPVITFHGDSEHNDFVRWIDENPNGFLINRASDMLHCADCSAFVFHDPGYCLTTNMKVCSLSRDRLEHWAEWRFWVHLEYCSRCKP